uniref:tetratricopeptide repeat-containing sensor histidine kinase n=1 Tax=Flavobacterium sp. TaxID=239 RepID=UPI0040484086
MYCSFSSSLVVVLKDKKGIQESYNNIGNIYMYQEKLKEALKYQFLSIKIAKELGDKQSIGDAYTNIGIIYIDQKKFTEAIKSHLVSLKILEEIGDAIGVGGAYGNIGAAYMYKGDYQKALENYFKSLEIRKSLNHKAGVAYSYLGIGMTQLEMHNPKEAKKYLEKTLQISKELNIKRLIKYSYKNLTKADSALTNYKGAFENYKIYVIYRDSLTNEETERKSLQTVMQYEYDKKEALIKEETEAKVFQSKAEKKQNQIIYSSIIVFLLTILSIIVIGFYFYKKKQKTEKLLKDKELALEIADNERRRISADLHDDLGAGISSIALLSNRIQFQESMDDVRVDASYIIENTKKVSQKLTEVIWELNSEHNNLEDLLLFIQKQGNDLFKETTTHFSMLIPIEIQDIYFSSYERKQIYLSVKECFHNIIKHAVASKVSCKTKINEVLIITIKDNGIGFNVNEKINSSTGEGLNNLKYRVTNLNGKVIINSNQEGTVITLEIPLNKN